MDVGIEIMAKQNGLRHCSYCWFIIYESHLVGTNMIKAYSKYEAT